VRDNAFGVRFDRRYDPDFEEQVTWFGIDGKPIPQED
jgi:hypothetical protein